MLRRLVIVVISVAVLASTAGAQSRTKSKDAGSDWPWFLGPTYDRTSPEKGLLREWPAGGPKELWRIKVGPGWSAPSIAGTDLVIHSYDGPGELVRCLDAATGKERWSFGYPLSAPTWAWGIGWDKGGPRGTPTITDKYVVTLGILGDLYCLDRKTGKPLWSQSPLKGKEPKNPGDWKGYCHSPIVVGNAVVLEQGNADVLALDLKTGKELWRYARPPREGRRGGGGQSPIPAKFGNDECVVMTSNARLVALRASDGKEVWSFDHLPNGGRVTNIPSPLIVGNYIFDIPDLAGPVMVELNRSTPPFPARVAWRKDFISMNYYHNLVPHQGYLYGFWTERDLSSMDIQNGDFDFVCLDMKSGREMWRQKNFKQAVSCIEVDGMLYARTHQQLLLIEATPKGWHLAGKIEKLHSLPTVVNSVGLVDWVLPVVSHGRLYVRLPGELVCYDAAAKGNRPAPTGDSPPGP